MSETTEPIPGDVPALADLGARIQELLGIFLEGVQKHHSIYGAGMREVFDNAFTLASSEFVAEARSRQELESELRRARFALMQEQTAHNQTKDEKNAAYLERDQVVILAAALAHSLGHSAGVGVDPEASPQWCRVVYLDLPTGQASWHCSPTLAPLIEGLPAYEGPWDRHTSPEKYRRIADFVLERPCPEPTS